jgi:hypothetical protein
LCGEATADVRFQIPLRVARPIVLQSRPQALIGARDCRIRIDEPYEISIALGMRVYRGGCCAKLNPTGFTNRADQATKP